MKPVAMTEITQYHTLHSAEHMTSSGKTIVAQSSWCRRRCYVMTCFLVHVIRLPPKLPDLASEQYIASWERKEIYMDEWKKV